MTAPLGHLAIRARRRAGRVGLLRAQADTREDLRAAVTAYAALRRSLGQHTDTLEVELIDGTTVTALVRIDLVPDPDPTERP